MRTGGARREHRAIIGVNVLVPCCILALDGRVFLIYPTGGQLVDLLEGASSDSNWCRLVAIVSVSGRIGWRAELS